MRRNIVSAIAGSLAGAHNATLPPPDAYIDEVLRQALARLDSDIDERTSDPPWARQAVGSSPSLPSTLLAFFDSESRVLHVANAGVGHASLGRRVGSAGPTSAESWPGIARRGTSPGSLSLLFPPRTHCHGNSRATVDNQNKI